MELALIVLVWWASGFVSLVWWMTGRQAISVKESILVMMVSILGPLCFIIGWVEFGEEDKIVFRRRK